MSDKLSFVERTLIAGGFKHQGTKAQIVRGDSTYLCLRG
jgi:hypothetical protein